MRRWATFPLRTGTLLLALASTIPVSSTLASAASLKGIVERVEGERFLVDSAWVRPARGARFSGTARNVGRIRVGDWAVLNGAWAGGAFSANSLRIEHEFPGHSFQHQLNRQGLQEGEKLSSSDKAYKNPGVEAVVTRVGESVVPGWARKEFRFQFHVISDPSLNAFALPDGSIFVHTGLLARVEDEAQLAAILGHEVAHVTEHHGAQGYRKNLTTFVPALIGAEVLGTQVARGTDNPFLKAATQMGLSLAVGAAVNGFGRTHEDQADRVGLRYAVEAGYDPASAPRVWDIFNETYGDQSKLENFFYGNHSTNKVRKANQEREIQRHYGAPSTLPVTRPADEAGFQDSMLSLTRDNAVLDFEAKRYPVARAGFERVLRRKSVDGTAHTYLGRIALAASESPDRFVQAESEFRKAIEGEPSYPDSHKELGRLLASQNKKEEARKELEEYLRLAPASAKDRKDVEKEVRKLS